MRFLASVYAVDERPERPKSKKEADDKKPKGGWRTKSGVRRLGERATLEADSFGGAVYKVGTLIGKLSDDAQSNIVRVRVEIDESSTESGGNPFDES